MHSFSSESVGSLNASCGLAELSYDPAADRRPATPWALPGTSPETSAGEHWASWGLAAMVSH